MLNALYLLAPIIGEVKDPYVAGYQGLPGIAIFLSNLIKLITVIAGLLLFLNLVFAGLKYILSGSDPKAIQEAGSSITNSIIGLVIIAAAFIITAIISILFFGDPTAILNLKIYGPGTKTAPPDYSTYCDFDYWYDPVTKTCERK